MTNEGQNRLHEFVIRKRIARDFALKGANLRHLQAVGLRADGLHFDEADLREASLRDIRWQACSLRDARLDSADLTKAVLRLCDLDRACITGARLESARLENSTARGARFDGADLRDAVLSDTDFSRASFRDTNLERISASGACFRGADFRGAKLRNAELRDADLRGADLRDADLDGADLSGADLRGFVGDHPKLQRDATTYGEVPPEVRSLAETMAPIVGEVLRSAGERGVIDNDTAQRLVAEAAAYQGASRRHAPSAETLSAVTRVLDGMGDNGLAALFGALQAPAGDEPPTVVKGMIVRLRKELGMDETASVEDVLSRLLSRSEP